MSFMCTVTVFTSGRTKMQNVCKGSSFVAVVVCFVC